MPTSAPSPVPRSPAGVDGAVRHRALQRWARLGAALSFAGLAGCGGGVTIGFGGAYDDSPPSVSLATSVSAVRAGQTLRLVAAAADENGIDTVLFYRFDGGVATSIGSRNRPPFEVDTVAPADGRTAMVLFARAFDNAGNPADSDRVTVTITP